MWTNKILQTVVFSVVFLLVLVIIGLTKWSVEPIHVLIALMPLIILLIVTGKLKEIKGPGGIELTLQEEAKKHISPLIEQSPLEIKPELIREKSTVGQLKNLIKRPLPTTLSFQLDSIP